MNTQITLSEAAKMAGVSVSTVRRWVSESRIKGLKTKDGVWRVSKESLLVMLSTQGASMESVRRVRGASAIQAEAPDSTSVALLKEALERERRINDELRAVLIERDATIRALETEMRAILSKENSGLLSRWTRR